MTVGGTLYTPEKYYRSYRIEIAAKISGASITKSGYTPGKFDETDDFKAKYPAQSCPVFESNDKKLHLFDASAIARHVGNDQLRGGQNEAQVIQWCNWADNVIAPAMSTWVYPCLGVIQYNKGNTEKAKQTITTALKHMNEYLLKVTYLVGERLTQADVTVFCNFLPLYQHVLDKAALENAPHFRRWFTTIANQPAVKAVVGAVTQCTKPGQFDAKKYAELHPKGDDAGKGKKEKGGQQPPQQQKKKETPKKADSKKGGDDNDDDDDDMPKKKEEKDPLALLPKGNMDMDDFKRKYSNNPPDVSIPYFWEKFDPEHYSVWYCKYKYPEELKMIFMTCNLVGGMFQRLEGLRKHGFGVMSIFGVDRNNDISGVWFWRGTGLVFELSNDLTVDYDSYDWKKLDHNDPETKRLVDMYWGDKYTPDQKFNQAKVFK